MPNAIGTSSSGSNFCRYPCTAARMPMMIMIRLRGSSAKDAKPELARMLPNAPKTKLHSTRPPSYIVQVLRRSVRKRPSVRRQVPTVPSCGAQILILHLHGLENEQHIAALNGLTCRASDIQNGARHGRCDGLAACRRCCGAAAGASALPTLVPVLLQPVPVRELRRSVLRLPTLFLLLLQTACR